MGNTLLNIISEWATANKRFFWKYEVSSFYKTYQISIINLPAPSNEDIKLKSYKRMLNNEQKSQLSDTIKKAYAGTEELDASSINVKIDYVSGAVVASFTK